MGNIEKLDAIEPPAEPKSRPRRGLLRIAGMYVIALVALAPLTHVYSPRDIGSLLIYACIGVILAAVALIGVWGAFAPMPYLRRNAVGIGGGVLLLFGGVLSNVAFGQQNFSSNDANAAAQVFFAIPLFFLAIQLAPWCIRHFRRYEIVSLSSQASRPRYMTLRDVFSGTAMIAIALASAQIGHSVSAGNDPPERNMYGPLVSGFSLYFFLFGWIIAVPVAFANLCGTIAPFQRRSYRTFVFLLLIVPLGFLSLRPRSLPPAIDFLGYWVAVVTFLFATSTTLRYVRNQGYILQKMA